jgi:hypothetical protein
MLTITVADILCYHQAVEISLYEIGLSHALNNEDDKSYRLGILYSFLLAITAFFGTHLTHAFPMTAARAYITYVQVEYAIRMGIKLLRFPATEGWDSDHARVVLDFPGSMEMAISKLEAVIRIRSRSGEQQRSRDGLDVFIQYLNNMKCLKNWSESLESASDDLRCGSGTSRSQPVAEHERQGIESGDPSSGAGKSQSFSDNFLMINDSDNFLWEALNSQDDDWMVFGS